MNYDVAIVGAGAAGLLAARTLTRAGRSVVLLEARNRFGGRLLEVADPLANAPIELGGEFVHGRPDVTYGLLREFGSGVIDDAGSSFELAARRLRTASDDPFTAAGAILATALDRSDDESVEALLERVSQSTSSDARAWTRRLVAGFDAADPARASARAIALEWAGDASASGAQSRPSGGYAPLIAHLARSLDATRADVRLQTIVRSIERDDDGVRVHASTGDRQQTFEARHAIVTVPHGVLEAQPGSAGAIAFDPPLPAATHDAIAHIAMGPVVKVVLRFRTAFWETLDDGEWRDAAFVHGDGAFPTLWMQLPVRATTIVAWAGGTAADPFADATEDERSAVALACVGRYFGDTPAAEDAFACAYQHDWQADPFSRGAYSYVVTGGESARETLARPIDGVLWFAGEATASHGEGGTVAGALESGARAASEILTRFRA